LASPAAQFKSVAGEEPITSYTRDAKKDDRLSLNFLLGEHAPGELHAIRVFRTSLTGGVTMLPVRQYFLSDSN
jgi:hypothetical protein